MSYEMLQAYTQAERGTMARKSKVVVTLGEAGPICQATVKTSPVNCRISSLKKEER
jgi:hypothetical protein